MEIPRRVPISEGHHVAEGELPDYLPAVLELAAGGGEESAITLLQEHRVGLLVLLEALDELASPYAGSSGGRLAPAAP